MDKINKIYTDPKNPGSYSSAASLIKAVRKKYPKISREEVLDFLERNRTATLFKQARKRFRRSRTIPTGYLSRESYLDLCIKVSILDLQCDLGDFQSLSKENKGYRYLLLAVDVLSRQIFGAPTKSKRPTDMMHAFDEIFKQTPFLPESAYTDRGFEFESKEMKKYFEDKGIEKYAAKSSAIKAAVVERAIRTLKNRYANECDI
jgi:hypothetical protein